jgi:hypothetical protein
MLEQHPANLTHNPQLHIRPTTCKPKSQVPQAAAICITLELLMMDIMVPETCWANNKFYSKKTNLLHLVGLLFPHINDDARSDSHQVYRCLSFRIKYYPPPPNTHTYTHIYIYKTSVVVLNYVLHTLVTLCSLSYEFLHLTLAFPLILFCNSRRVAEDWGPEHRHYSSCDWWRRMTIRWRAIDWEWRRHLMFCQITPPQTLRL